MKIFSRENKTEILTRFRQIIEDCKPNEMGQNGLVLAGLALLLVDDAYKIPKPTKDNNWAQDVLDFHERFGINYVGGPRMLEGELKAFRIARSEEEHKEYLAATVLEQAIDAIIDQVYILLGTAHVQGFTPSMINESWKRVHAANMAKERASAENPGKYGSPHDIVKPKGWMPPRHTDIIEKAMDKYASKSAK